MILYDLTLAAAYQDYGIMLPISPSRSARIMTFLDQTGALGLDPLKPVFDCPGARRFLGDPVLQREDLERVHQREFIAALYEEGPQGSQGLEKALFQAWELIDPQGRPRRYEPERATKPLRSLFHRVLAQVEGAYLAARLAQDSGFCYYLSGGMHHARYDHGTGFCLLNDIMIAARKLQAENRAQFIWVVDVDAHKGCGTAELIRFARDRGELGKDQEVADLSIHMGSGWPLDEETLKEALPDRAPRIRSDVEIPIAPGDEGSYLGELTAGLTRLEALFPQRKPDLVMVVDGADPYQYDGLPSSALLQLSLEQCLERDRLLYGYFQARGIPSVWIMAGGYGERAWEPPAYFLQSLSKNHTDVL